MRKTDHSTRTPEPRSAWVAADIDALLAELARETPEESASITWRDLEAGFSTTTSR